MKYIPFAFLLLLLFSCNNSPETSAGSEDIETMSLTERLPAANIYEVNIRQYTPEGTFTAFEEHLPRLKKMGVDILWFMPIFPISEEKRKGPMGSYYSVSSYRDINPEFGTLEEFKKLVDKMHSMGFIVILDWVPNHTGWDHNWIKEHPDWYKKDPIADTIIHPSGTDWYDVAGLNYDNPELRAAMIKDLLFWIEEVDIDGYRMDVCDNVPIDFWREAIGQLNQSKELFMVAEAAYPPHRNEGIFHTSYAWDMLHSMNKASKGEATIQSIWEAFEIDRAKYEKGWHMCFTTNHDENSWNGTVFERYGDKHLSYAVLAFTLQGMPLIYSGQEAGLDKALRFFEKDTIDWSDIKYEKFYSTLLQLKHDHPALFNGKYGGDAQKLDSSDDVIAYYREKVGDTVMVAINLGDAEGTWDPAGMLSGEMTEVFTGSKGKEASQAILAPGEYQIWTN